MRQESLEALGAVPVIIEAGKNQIELAREHLPGAIAATARIVLDNPKSMLVLASGAYVTGRVIARAVRPDGLFGMLACMVVAGGLAAAGSNELIKRGIIEIRVRDDHGCLVPLHGDA